MSRDKTCKTCCWWSCFNVARGTGECQFIDSISATSRVEDSVEVVVTVADDHNLNVSLMTGPEFGCVRHSPKTDSF